MVNFKAAVVNSEDTASQDDDLLGGEDRWGQKTIGKEWETVGMGSKQF